jgi:tetratricopeptide (TPR) repeat protein
MIRKIFFWAFFLTGMALLFACSPQTQPQVQPQNPVPSLSIQKTPLERSSGEWMELAAMQVSAGQYQDAVDAYQNVINKEPDRMDAYLYQAKCYKCLASLTKAMATLDSAIERNPKNKEIWREKADVYTQLREFDKAAQAYEKVAEIGGESAGLNLQMAMCFESMQDFDRAGGYFLKNLEKYPQRVSSCSEYASHWMRRAQVEKKLDSRKSMASYQKAADWYLKAYEKTKAEDEGEDKPGQLMQAGSAYFARWKITKSSQDRQKAKDCLDRFLKMSPGHPYKGLAKKYLNKMKEAP